MKKAISLLLALVMILSLAACGGNTPANDANTSEPPAENTQPDTEPGAQPAEPTPEPSPEESHYPVTITNVNFAKEPIEYTYEEAPQWVITFWSNSLETMLALGLGDRVICAVGMSEDEILPELHPELEKMKSNVEYYGVLQRLRG